MKTNRHFIPQAVFYAIASLLSYFLSDKVKDGFELNTPPVILMFEIFAVIIITSFSWFVYLEKKKRSKQNYLKIIRTLLISFAVVSLLFFIFINRFTLVYNSGGIHTTIVGMFHKGNYVPKSEAINILEGSSFESFDAFSDLSIVKNALIIFTLIYIIAFVSLFSVIIDFSGLELKE